MSHHHWRDTGGSSTPSTPQRYSSHLLSPLDGVGSRSVSRTSSITSNGSLFGASASRVSIQEREERRRFLNDSTLSSPRAYEDIHRFAGIDAQERLSSYHLKTIAEAVNMDSAEAECLEHYELNLEKNKDERDSVQKKTFSKWVNRHLHKAAPERTVVDLFNDLRDGVNLIILLEALSSERLHRERGTTPFHRIQNVQSCLDFLKRKNIKLVNIRAEDIVDGNGKLTLGLIWTIILNFQVSQIQRRQHENGNGEALQSYEVVHGDNTIAARDALLKWTQKVTSGYPRVGVTNFGSSWRDGLAFNAILHRYRPTLVRWNEISASGVTNFDRLEKAFDVAEKEFGVTRLLDPEDVDMGKVDERSMITYVSLLSNALPPMPELGKLEHIQMEYLREAQLWLDWVVEKTEAADNRLFIGTSDELLAEMEQFRVVLMPPKASELAQLVDIYTRLEHLAGTDHFRVPPQLSTRALRRAWFDLVDAVERRAKLLEERTSNQSSADDLISRLNRGIGIINEKLDIIVQKIEDLEVHVDRLPSGEVERKVDALLDELTDLESPIDAFNEDIDSLQPLPEAADFRRLVLALHQRRRAYIERLSNRIMPKLVARTDSMRRDEVMRVESVSSSTFLQTEESIRRVREYADRIAQMRFVDDLETLESVFEQHKIDNRDIQDYRQVVDDCIRRQHDVPAERTPEYCDVLRILEREYQQLRDFSAGRMLDLDSLIAFVRAAQLELVWISEREKVEITRNWSNTDRLDLPMLQNYYKQILHEMELRNKQFDDVYNQGAALLKSGRGHPAAGVIEVYLQSMRGQWTWLLSLSKCLEVHLRDALDASTISEDAHLAEQWMENQLVSLEEQYTGTDFDLEQGEQQLSELQKIKEILGKYNQTVLTLAERARHVSPLWLRGDRVARSTPVIAIIDYTDSNVAIRAGDEVSLLDSSDLTQWRVRDLLGHEGIVPSVVFRLPPPNSRLNTRLTLLVQQCERLSRLWERKERHVRYHMVSNTMRTIQHWSVDQFQSVGEQQRDEIMRALGDDIRKLASEIGDNDPMAVQLRSDLRTTTDSFRQLHERTLKTPEPDLSDQYDQQSSFLLRRLEDSWRNLNERVSRPLSRNVENLEKSILEHEAFENALQALDNEVSSLTELYDRLEQPNNVQRLNRDKVGAHWANLWDLSRMYVERIKVLESAVHGLADVEKIVAEHEIALCSANDLSSDVDGLSAEHRQLIERNMMTRQQQPRIDSLNKDAASLRQHVARTRIDATSHPDVDRFDEEVQQLNVRWENVSSQLADRVDTLDRNLQLMLVYRSGIVNENSWLDKVEATISQLRRPEDLKPDEYQRSLDVLVAEYSQLQERTTAVEAVNREGGKYIRDAKNYDVRLEQYLDNVLRLHGHGFKKSLSRTDPQPKNGARMVSEELELLNKRFAQLSSLILERRNEVQVVIQSFKRQKQEEAVQQCIVRQKELSAAINDLSNFEEKIYTNRVSINLNQQRPEDAAEGIESVKASLDEWASRVREQLENVDRMCAEQADQLPPEQFAVLKQKRDELARTYETTVRNVEIVYERLHEITRLLIEFSNESSSMQSWITGATRRAGDIRAQSANPSHIAEQRTHAKNLQEEVATGEARLKQIGSLVARIESEIAAMRQAVPQVQLGGVNSDDVKKTSFRVEDDYNALVRLCQDLGTFQNRIANLGADVDQRTGKANDWLRQLEGELAELFSKKDIPVEQRLNRAGELNKKLASEQSNLDEADQAASLLLSALEGTDAYDEVKQRQETEQAARRKRKNSLFEQLQQAVNDATTEQAIANGVRDAVGDLAKWADDFESKVSEPRTIPLREDELLEMKKAEQLAMNEADTRLSLAGQLEAEVRKISVSSPTTAKDANLEENLGSAKRKLGKANSLLRGFRDNVDDALGSLRDLRTRTDSIQRKCDALQQQVKTISPKETDRLSDARNVVAALGQDMADAEKLANKLLSIPGISNTDMVENAMKETGAKLDSLADAVDEKCRKADSLAQIEAEFEQKKAHVQGWLADKEKTTSNIEPLAVDSDTLCAQKEKCAQLIGELHDGAPLLEELERLSVAIAEIEAVPGSRASSVPRNVLDLRTKFDQLNSAAQQRCDAINSQLAKASVLNATKNAVAEWIEDQRKKLANEIPLELSKEGVKSAQSKLDRIAKDSRQGQRKIDELRMQTRDLMRANPDAAAALTELEADIDGQWETLLTEQDSAKKRVDDAEKIVDGIAQVDRWLAGKQRVLDALGAASTEPHMAKGQQNQIHMLKVDAENEESNLERINDLAEQLMSSAVTDKDKEAVREKIGELNARWQSLNSGLDGKHKAVKKAADLGSEIAQLNKDIKKKIAELEHEVDAASRLPSSAVDRQLSTLDALKARGGEVDAMLERLAEKEREADAMDLDPTNRAEIAELASTTRTKANELDKKIDSFKAAALSVRDEGDALEKHVDQLLADIQLAAFDVHNAQPVCADPAKLAEQCAKFEKVYADVLAKEGDVGLIKSKLQDQLLANPKPELKAKLDRLAREWTPLLEATKERRANLEKVNDLVKKFKDAEAALQQHLVDDGNELSQALDSASVGDQADAASDALRPVEGALERRTNEAEALDALASRIEKTAPGPDARHLKRGAENLLDDVRTHAKRARSAVQTAQKKADLCAKFNRLADDAYALCAAREAELDNDTGNLTRDRLQGKLAEVESYWPRVGRELAQLRDELQASSVPAEIVQQNEATVDELGGLFENLIDKMKSIDARLGEKKEEGERAREQTNRLATRLNSVYSDLNDLEPIGRSLAELDKQKEQCDLLRQELAEREKQLEEAEKSWQDTFDNGAVSPAQFASNQQNLDDLKKLIGKGKKKLDDREKKIDATAEEVEKVQNEATAVVGELSSLLACDALQSQGSLGDPKAQAEALRELKDRLRPLGERADAVQAECKVLIKTAAPDADTKQLSANLSDVAKAVSNVNAAVSTRQMAVDAAVQQMGSYNDAYKSLLNWLEETEELVDNQKAPSADPKVAKAQLQSYDVLLKHIEEKQASVDGFGTMIAKLCDMTGSEEEMKALTGKSNEINARFGDLLATAQRGQTRLRDAADLAERVAAELGPFEHWIAQTDKRIGLLGNVPTDSTRLEEQIRDVEEILRDVDGKSDAVEKIVQLGPKLAALVSVEDAGDLENQLTAATGKHEDLANRAEKCYQVLNAMGEQIQDFEADVAALSQWLDQIEQDMSSIEELPINPDELLEQTNLLSELVESVTDRDALVSNVVRVGKTLCKATTADEAIALQSKVEGLRNRYMEVAAYADEKLLLLSRAIPLSERFHEGIEAVMEWVEAVEDDLRMIDTVDLETQQQLVTGIEEDVAAQWRPEVDDLVAVSSQLQQLAGPERADELHAHTQEMVRRVHHIADQVGRRAERLDLTEKQSRAVVDELDFVLEWLGDAKERVLHAPPLAIDPDYLKAQLRNQKLLNEDLALQKARLREATAECRKVARQIGPEAGQDAALLQKADSARDLSDEVSAVCAERTENLEQAVALAEQIGASFEDMNDWLDQVDDELSNQPPVTTATPPQDLSKQQQHNIELSAVIAAQRPLVERFQKDVAALAELVSEDDKDALAQIAEQVVGRFADIQGAVKARGEGIDSILDATEAFGDRLDVFLATLEGAAESLRQPAAVSADPSLLQNRIAENEALLESLKDKESALNAMKERAADLLARAQPGDVAAAEVAAKIQALEQLWQEIGDGAQLRGAFLNDALDKANRFWNDLDSCQKAIDDLKARLETIEPAIGHPQRIHEQQKDMDDIHHDVEETRPKLDVLRYAGSELCAIIPEEEKAAVEQQVDMVGRGFDTITKLFADKSVHLGNAMEQAMQFHDDLAALNEFLDKSEQQLKNMGPTDGLPVEMIEPKLEELQQFRSELDDHAMLKEQINQTAQGLVAGAPAHQTGAVRAPIAELNGRWSRLYGDIADREHKIERAMLEMGRLGEAVEQIAAWMDKTQANLDEMAVQAPSNLRTVEVQQCKLAVVANDVHAHEPSIKSINAAAAKMLRGPSGDASGKTGAAVQEMNEKWKLLGDSLDKIGSNLERAKGAAEDVGGEMERWLAYVEDVEGQLATTKPTGGLPETARQHLDDFLVFKAEVEQNTPALESHMHVTDDYLSAHPDDEASWIGKTAQKLRIKWKRCKDLLADREKKLTLALEEAIALEEAMVDTTHWVEGMETALSGLSPIGRLPETLDKQRGEHRLMAEDVTNRKALVGDMQSTGTRMQYYCEKKDAIPIKNGLVSLRHRFEKIAQRVAERGKQLDAAQAETDAWLESAKDLEFWLDEMGVRVSDEMPSTANNARLQELRDEAKEVQRELATKRPSFEQFRKRGLSVAEHAPKNERKAIERENAEMKRKWDEVEKAAIDRLRQAEEAVLESGAFDDAIGDLEAWCDAELLDAETDLAAQGVRVHGDIDTVRGLLEDDRKRADERAAKKRAVDKLIKKADELLHRGVAEGDDVKAARDRLEDKWKLVEAAADVRSEALRNAQADAEDFDAKAHALLDWLAKEEKRLIAANREPDLDKAIAAISDVLADLQAEEPRRDNTLAAGAAIQTKAHPMAVQPMRHWNKVLAARWKEVEDRAQERLGNLKEEKAHAEERERNIKELRAFIARKREELNALTAMPTPDDLTTVDNMLRAHEQLDFDLTEKQPEVDAAIKGAGKGADRNPRAIELANDWKQLWLDSIGHKNALDDCKGVLEEMKRLEGWQWEDWKERYLDFNDHGKARVTDLFRRIDRTATGNVPRKTFVEAIISSKFPTSRLEMEKVADLFDKSGFINSKDFINALRFDKSKRPEPKTEQEKITQEIERQAKQCSCCQPYKIEKISEGHYRFGDTQIKRMLRILRSTVMVRVGGGWEALDEFLQKHDPCRAKGRLNINMFYNDVRPINAIDTMAAFTKGRHARMLPGGSGLPSSGTPGPIMKIREKTDRSVPMFPGSGIPHSNGSTHSSSSRLRTPSDLSLGDSRIGRGFAASSASSLNGSRPPSRASEAAADDRPTRIPSLRGKKGTRYNPPRQL